MSGLFFDSVLTCPVCGQQQVCRLPYDKRLESFYCKGCECEITVPDDECCIFCAFGSHKCLVYQGWEKLEQKQMREKIKSHEYKTEKKSIPALGYDFLTAWYDATIRFTMPEKKFRNELIDHLKPEPYERIFEFGYGTGANLVIASSRSPNSSFFGLDIDPKVREIAFSKLEEKDILVELQLYAGGIFPYDDAVFDKVYSCLVFHQLDDETKAHCLREIYRVLKPGGQLIIGDWGKASSRWMRTAFYAVQLLDGFKTTNANVQGRLPQFIKEAGFSHVSETGHINTRIGTFCYYEGTKHQQE
jgi:ubiquinone/menaquinone biosynthesis C-methylase UbiE